MNFQTILHRLGRYWRSQGCALLQPYDSEVATGILYPQAFFRLLGETPWRAAYVASARRPSDGRYGGNPYRLQHYLQYQVLLKPSSQDVQAQYLASLQALDIDLKAHDLRFVEDTWELNNLGAWGLGWDVWLDGLSITRITYLQQLGGVALEPVTVKLSYGLARLAMHLQGVTHVYDVQYDTLHQDRLHQDRLYQDRLHQDTLNDGILNQDTLTQDTRHQNTPQDGHQLTMGHLEQTFEEQQSSYNFNHVNSTLQRDLFEHYEAEVERLLELKLVYPAYDFVIKANHAYNLLAVRDNLPQTERQMYSQRLRRLSEEVARRYLEHDYAQASVGEATATEIMSSTAPTTTQTIEPTASVRSEEGR
ncbi:MAG: glycine--tRNA ligase subunit alpha [Deinococcota bacterium]